MTRATVPAALSEAPANGDDGEQTQQAGRLDGSELFPEEQTIVDIRSTWPTLLPHEQLNKSILFAALRSGGVKNATLTFQGGGDEGHIESVSYETEPGREFDDSVTVAVHAIRGVFENGQWDHTITLVEIPFESALEEFAWTVHQRLHADWHDGEGGSAEMFFTVGPDGVDSIVVDHNDNYVESVNTVTTL